MRRPGHNARQVARSLESFIEAFRRVARTSDRGWIEERDHVVSVATGIPVAAFNPTFVVDVPGDPTAAAIADAARSAGYVAGHRSPCMLLEPLVATTPVTPDPELWRVEDAATLRTFNDVCAEAFGLDRRVLAVLDDPRMLEVQGFGFHLGLVDGRAVGAADHRSSARNWMSPKRDRTVSRAMLRWAPGHTVSPHHAKSACWSPGMSPSFLGRPKTSTSSKGPGASPDSSWCALAGTRWRYPDSSSARQPRRPARSCPLRVIDSPPSSWRSRPRGRR